jgi:hypothetical protein
MWSGPDRQVPISKREKLPLPERWFVRVGVASRAAIADLEAAQRNLPIIQEEEGGLYASPIIGPRRKKGMISRQ